LMPQLPVLYCGRLVRAAARRGIPIQEPGMVDIK